MGKLINKTEDNSAAVDIQLRGIYVSEFRIGITDDFIKLDSETKGGFKNFTFEITCVNNAIIPENLVNIQVIVKVFLDIEKQKQLGLLSLSNMFFINDLKRFANDENKTYTLPPDAEASLVGISLSHSRAILLAKCAGTFLQNALLPVMDPKAFVKNYK